MSKPGPLRFGAFEVNPHSGRVSKHGLRLKIHDKAFQVLLALLERPGQVITREELRQRLWPEDVFVGFDNNLNNAVSRLREALGDVAESPRYIETIPRRGYRFIAPVEAAEAATSPLELQAGHPAPSRVPGGALRRPWLLAAGLAAALVSAVLLYRALSPAPHSIQAVAVLPFVTAGSDDASSDHYVAFGMTEALISELSKLGGLKVISQTSVLRYKENPKPLPAIARELGVGAVVEGSVVREGEQVRITVQLIEAAGDTHLWAETYRYETAGVMAQQSELARSVASEIRTRLTGESAPPLPPARPANPAAEEAYLKGRYFFGRRGEKNLARAREYLQQAIAADPTHARAHAALADFYTVTDSVAPEVSLPKARTEALRALELDNDLADAHVSLAYVYYYADWNWREAEKEFQRAIALNPNHAQARFWYGRFLGTMGRHQEAESQIAEALALDPLFLTVLDTAAMQAFFTRQFDKMLEYAGRMLELNPDDQRAYEHLAVAYLFTNRLPQAASAAQRGLELLPHEPLFVLLLAVVQNHMGRAAEAARMLGELERMNRDGYVPALFRAIAFAQLGRKEQALRLLQLGYRNRDPYMVMLKALPWFDPLRSDPRFQELLRQLNFPQ